MMVTGLKDRKMDSEHRFSEIAKIFTRDSSNITWEAVRKDKGKIISKGRGKFSSTSSSGKQLESYDGEWKEDKWHG